MTSLHSDTQNEKDRIDGTNSRKCRDDGYDRRASTMFAQENGWRDATSEEAQESGRDFAAHASGQDDDPNGPGDPPFDENDDTPGRQGIGNVGDDPDDEPGPGIHPDGLGQFLDCVDQDDDDDPPESDC